MASGETAPHLHEGEGWSRAEGLVLVFQLVAHIFLHALLRVDPLLLVHAEQGSGGHSNGDGILRLGLQGCSRRGRPSASLRQVSSASPSGNWGQGEAPGPASALRSSVLGRDRPRLGSPLVKNPAGDWGETMTPHGGGQSGERHMSSGSFQSSWPS